MKFGVMLGLGERGGLAHPDYAAPQAKVDAIAALLHSGRFPLLE